MNVFLAQPGLFGNDFLVVALIAQLLDARQEFQRAEFAPCDVLRQAHDEGRFVVYLGDHRRDFSLADSLEGLEASFATDQQIALAITPRPWCHDDRLFQPDALNIADNLLEDATVALTRIEYVNALERDHPQFQGAMLGVVDHAALRMRIRRAIP